MIEIVIDVSDLKRFEMQLARAQLMGFPNGIDQLVKGMEEIRQDWIDYARYTLRNYNYAQELEDIPVQYPYGGDPHAAACIGGDIAAGVEYGTKAWDMKPGFLEGNMVHQSGPPPNGFDCWCGENHVSKKPARWVNIPFRHGTPGTSGRLGAPMPSAIHAAAKQLEPYKSVANRKDFHLERLTPRAVGIHPNFAEQGQRTQFRIPAGVHTKLHGTTMPNPKSRAGFATYTHKTGLYNDMVRVVKPAGKGVHVQYMTWRRVSSNSSAASWWFPARAATPVTPIIVDRNQEKLRERVRYGISIDMGMAPSSIN